MKLHCRGVAETSGDSWQVPPSFRASAFCTATWEMKGKLAESQHLGCQKMGIIFTKKNQVCLVSIFIRNCVKLSYARPCSNHLDRPSGWYRTKDFPEEWAFHQTFAILNHFILALIQNSSFPRWAAPCQRVYRIYLQPLIFESDPFCNLLEAVPCCFGFRDGIGISFHLSFNVQCCFVAPWVAMSHWKVFRQTLNSNNFETKFQDSQRY